MSPILRFHSGNGNERRPWCYPETARLSAQLAIQWRMELLPYLYTLARQTYDSGLPMVRRAVLAFPEWHDADSVWHAPLQETGGSAGLTGI
jgi:alpha-glucosidase (family GH31 glycosyl hydrolase)